MQYKSGFFINGACGCGGVLCCGRQILLGAILAGGKPTDRSRLLTLPFWTDALANTAVLPTLRLPTMLAVFVHCVLDPPSKPPFTPTNTRGIAREARAVTGQFSTTHPSPARSCGTLPESGICEDMHVHVGSRVMFVCMVFVCVLM